MEKDMNPAEDASTECELFVGATIRDQNDNTMYGDLTGRFPVQSFRGNNVILWPMYMGQMQSSSGHTTDQTPK